MTNLMTDHAVTFALWGFVAGMGFGIGAALIFVEWFLGKDAGQ